MMNSKTMNNKIVKIKTNFFTPKNYIKTFVLIFFVLNEVKKNSSEISSHITF